MLIIRQFLILFFFLITVFCVGQRVVFVDRESFDGKGGWVSDHQAFENIR